MKTKNADLGVRFVLFLAMIHLANENVDNVILKKKSIILANQSVLAVFSAKYFVQNLKNMTLIYIHGKDIKVSIWLSVDKYQSQWYR